MKQIGFVLLAGLGMTLGAAAKADTAVFEITVNTTPLAGQPGFVAFDFVDGDSQPNNAVTVEAFAGDVALAELVLSGDADGALIPGPLVLGDAQFFNSARQEVVFATTMSFRLEVSSEGPHLPFPDAFAFFLLDDQQRPFASTDPTGADALFVLEIDGPEPRIEVFESAFAGVTVGGGGLEITAIRAQPDVLWPPNGRMVPVQIEVELSSGADPVQLCAIANVHSNEEPIDGDFEVTAPLALDLRARRHGSGGGRVYTVDIACQGGASESTEVRVPRDMKPPPG